MWARTLAPALMLLIFWIDTITPLGIAVPALYIAPILLFIAAGHYWEPLLVAAGATILTVIGAFLSPPGGSEQLGTINRPLELMMVWTTAAGVAHYRRTLLRWTRQYTIDRKAREESMERLEEMRYALDQAAIVAITDQKGTILHANDKFCEISKYSREELLGRDHRIINSGYHSKEFIREMWRTIAQGGIWRGELRNRAKDGSIYWVDTTIVPLLNAEGKPRQYLAIRSDVTQRKAAEQQLADQAALAQLGQLAAVVAHEVRNPLAGVKGSLQVLRSRLEVDLDDRRIIDAMISRMDTLNAKVEDILRFARPRSPVLEPVEVAPVVIDAIVSARAAAGDACPEITMPKTNAVVRADREMLRAALLNLLMNACQAGAGGAVDILVSSDDGLCRIEIADRGAGFGDTDPERLFEPFLTTKKGGTGLGLAIVRRFVSLQGGAVVLLPREGGGAIARMTLPSASAPV